MGLRCACRKVDRGRRAGRIRSPGFGCVSQNAGYVGDCTPSGPNAGQATLSTRRLRERDRNAFVLAATRRAKLGLDFSTWMAIVFVCVTFLLVGFRMLAILAFPTLALGAWLIMRNHPKMFTLWGLSLSQKSYYDPRKY